jgi:hypothetical protein
MNIKLYVFLIAAALAAVSCSDTKPHADGAKKPDFFIDDGYKKNEKNELIIEDKDLKYFQEIISTDKRSTQDKPFTATDGSQITVMSDGYGNKSIRREFNDHPRLQMVLVRASANGQKQVYVYAQNGEVKDLPANMFEKVLTTSADELAKAAGIFEGKRQRVNPQIFASITAPVQPAYQISTVIQSPTANQIIETKPLQTNEPQETIPVEAKTTSKTVSNETLPLKKLSENLQNFFPKKSKKPTSQSE